MKNTIGNQLTLTLFGESHGPAVGAVVDGLTPGLTVDEAEIALFLSRRRPSGETDTARIEQDHFQILSGVFEGKTTGTPLCVVIPNENTRSGDYAYGIARPGHADLTAEQKYHGFQDHRGGGHFSGRVTAALVAVGGILIPALAKKQIQIGTHILSCHGIEDRPFDAVAPETEQLQGKAFPVLDDLAGEQMKQEIVKAHKAGNSVGGVIQTAITGLPAGVGEPWFDSVEGALSRALFGLGGIKGVEFGSGFAFAGQTGLEANDAFCISESRIRTLTNRNGGINGGITNGMPVVFQCAVKPTPSVSAAQQTVDFVHGTEMTLHLAGRHDPAILRRICPVVDALTAFTVADMLLSRFGTDFLGETSCSTD